MKTTLSLLAPIAATGLVLALTSCKPPAPAETSSPTPAPAAKPAAEAAATPASTTPAETTAKAPAAANTLQLSDPVATVNGEKISRTQLDEAFNNVVKAEGVSLSDLSDEQKLEGYRRILDGLITERLVSKAAEGAEVPQTEVDSRLAEIKSQLQSEEAFNAWLGGIGQSPETVAGWMKKVLQQQHWLEGQIAGKADVTDEEAKKFFDENKDKIAPATVEASHILFMVEADAKEDQVKAKEEAAKKAAARARKGEDFAALAKELSEEPGAKESGGALGAFSEGEMIPEFSAAAFSQEVGSISDPVRTQYGWHVIKVTDKKAAGEIPFDKVKEQIKSYLKEQKQRDAVEGVIESLRGSAKIENTLPAPSPASATPQSAPQGAPAVPAKAPAAQ